MARLETWLSSLAAGSSATIFTAVGAGHNWRLLYANVSRLTTAGGATASVAILEQGTATTRLWVIGLATQQSYFEMNLAPAGGLTGVSAGSRLGINNADGGPIYGVFIGESW